MKAAVVKTLGQPPRFEEFGEPTAGPGEVMIAVKAAALSPLVRGHAAGRHYSSPKTLPFIAGVDGIGELADGTAVYFAFPRPPLGAMAERTVVGETQYVKLPKGIDVVSAAAAANPGMSSWAALTRRARLTPGEGVFINGATGAAGKLAIRVAKHLGARTIVVSGRNAKAIEGLTTLGADVALPLDGAAEETARAFQKAMEEANVTVVLDYLWGEPARRVLEAIARRDSRARQPRIRFVQIGSIAGGEIPLAAEVLRSTGVELMGSGIGSVPREDLLTVVGEFLSVAAGGGLTVEMEEAPLSEVESAWTRNTGERRLVFRV